MIERVAGVTSGTTSATDDMGWSPYECDSTIVAGGSGNSGHTRGANPRENRRPAQSYFLASNYHSRFARPHGARPVRVLCFRGPTFVDVTLSLFGAHRSLSLIHI